MAHLVSLGGETIAARAGVTGNRKGTIRWQRRKNCSHRDTQALHERSSSK
jgi:hypothetical protein